MPKVNITVFNQVLADFAQHFGNRKNKHMILVLDRAGWHSSQKLKVPQGLHLEFLPPHTPELQPAERLWPVINETAFVKRAGGNRSFKVSLVFVGSLLIIYQVLEK